MYFIRNTLPNSVNGTALLGNYLMNKIETSTRKKTWIGLSALIFLIVISSQGSIRDSLESDLGIHMIFEHALYFTMGALSIIASEYLLHMITVYERRVKQRINAVEGLGSILVRKWTCLLRKILSLNKYGLIWIAIATFLLVFWHLPFFFNLASESRSVHMLQHISFIVVGAAAFLAIRSLGDSSTIFILFSMTGMMGFSGLIFAILTERVYLFYSVDNHNTAGAYMIVTSILFLLVVLPVIIIKKTLHCLSVSSE